MSVFSGLTILTLNLHYIQAQIVNIEEMRITGTIDSLRWYGALGASFQLAKIQEQTILFQVESRVQYKKEDNLFLLLLNSELIRAGDKDFSNSAFAHLRYSRKLSETFAAEAFVQQQTNKLLLIKSRSLAGLGGRQRVIIDKTQNSRIYFGSAYLYEYNSYLLEISPKSWHRISNYISITLRNKKSGIVLHSTTYWQPVIGFIKNYRFSSEWNLEFPLWKKIRFSTDLSFSADHGLPIGAPIEVYEWKNGIVWRLH